MLAPSHQALHQQLRVVLLELRQDVLHKLPAGTGQQGSSGELRRPGGGGGSGGGGEWAAACGRCGASPCPPAAAPKVAIVHQQLLKLPDALPRHLWLLLVAALLRQALCRCSDAPRPCTRRSAVVKGAKERRQNLGAVASLKWGGLRRVQALH
jgi:hypothetical protein